MKQKFTLILFYITALSIAGFSQTGKSVVIGTMINKPNAVLVLNPPDGNQGFLLPQVTTANRLSIVPASPSEDGLVVYDITDKAFYFWKDSQWNKGLGGGQTLTYDQLTQKLSISNGNVVDLATLKEIPSVSGQAGKYITTDGTTLSWATLSNLGDITSIVTGKGLSGGVSSGDATLSVKTDNSTITFNGSDELQLSDGSVSIPKIIPGTPGTILVTDAGGLVKWQIGSGTDSQSLSLTGNTLNITNGSSANLNSVTASGQVGGTLNNLIIASNAVTAAMIQDGTIQAIDIGTLAITGTNIANATISSSKLNLSGVTSGTYGNATQAPQITIDAQGRITNAVATTITGVIPGGIAGGDLAGSYPIPTIAAAAGNNIGTAINTSASAGSINGSKISPNFGSQNITTSGNVTSTGTGALSIAGPSTLNGTLAVIGTTTLSNLGGGTNMVVAGPTGLLSTQPVPATITQGNLTTATTGLSITGGTNAVIGSGSTINIQNATGSQPGLLTAANFTTLNNKVGLTTTPVAGNISGSFSTGFQIVPGSANQVLITNGSSNVQWINQSSLAGVLALTGDVTGALNSNTVTKLQGINVSSTNPTDQQVLQYDNATSRWRPATVASITPTAFKMRQTFTQTINGTEMLIWDDEEYDDGGNNFFSNVFHVPSGGLYHFDAIVTFQTVDKSDDVEVMLRVAGADVHRAYGNTGQDDTNVSVSISTDIKLNAGDQVTLWGVTQNNRQTTGNPVRTQFSGRKVY